MPVEQLKKQIAWEERLNRDPHLVRKRVLFALALCVLLVAGSWYLYARTALKIDRLLAGAAVAVEQQEYRRAADALEEVIAQGQHDLKTAQALLQVGELYELFLGDRERALYYFLLLIKDYPLAEETYPALVRTAEITKYSLKDHRQALIIYQQLLDFQDPKADRYLYEIADCYFSLNNFEQARIEFENHAQQFPDSVLAPEVRFRIGMSFFLESAYDDANREFDQVMETWPGHEFAHEAAFAKGNVLEDQDLLLEARDYFTTLLETYPKPHLLESKLAQIDERIVRKKKAI